MALPGKYDGFSQSYLLPASRLNRPGAAAYGGSSCVIRRDEVPVGKLRKSAGSSQHSTNSRPVFARR
jgi:hypothetical protein